MIRLKKWFLNRSFAWTLLLIVPLFWANAVMSANSAFDLADMSDMSDYDPNNVVQPTGDTIKLGFIDIMTGPSTTGELYWPIITFVAHDLNKRGGIRVDGKMKKIEVIRGDTQGKPAGAKKAAERLCLEQKVDILWGASGSHLVKVIADVAKEYKVPFMNPLSLADELMDEKNFNRYTFRTQCNITQWNMALAYYFSKQPARKFSILCQDYMYGHSMGGAFKKYMTQYTPDAEIVSEDYHQLWLKDFAPYLTKIMAAGPDVLYTGDWLPDGDNLLKQARSMGLNLPVANIYITNPATLSAVGIEGSKNMIYCFPTIIGDSPRTEAQKKLMTKWPDFIGGQTISDTYWLFDVIARAGSTDPEKIIEVWEGDVYDSIQGVRTMRAEDHQAIFDIYVAEGTYPTQEVYPGQPYSENYAGVSEIFTVPQKYCTPPIPEGLKNR